MNNVKIAKSILALAKELVADGQDNKKVHKNELTDLSQKKQKLNSKTEKTLATYSKALEGLEIPQTMKKMTVGQLIEILDRIANGKADDEEEQNG